MPRTRVVIQSRLNSSRLPGKALLAIAGMPMIELVARRASRSGHEVIVATSREPYDGLIAAHLESVGIPVVRGSLDDVLGRFVDATADLADDDTVVRLTGDNPVADADLVDELLGAMAGSGHTYGRVDIEKVPEGLGAEAFSVAALREANARATDAYDREHVTPWLRRNLGELLFEPDGCPGDIDAYRATVDTLGDFVRVSGLYGNGGDPVAVPWLDLMRSLEAAVDDAGPRVPRSASSDAGLIISARRFALNPDRLAPAEHSEVLRAMLASAVDRGVTHVDLGADEGDTTELFRACAEPALTRRLAVIARVSPDPRPPLGTEGPAQADLEPDPAEAPLMAVLGFHAAAERLFARLGRRGVDTLVCPSPRTATVVWPALCELRDAGLVRRLGVAVTSTADLHWAADTAEIGYVEIENGIPSDSSDPPDPSSPADPSDPAIEKLSARNAAIVVRQEVSEPIAAWATAIVVSPTDAAQLDDAIRSVAASGAQT